jgi:hypothetical protein
VNRIIQRIAKSIVVGSLALSASLQIVNIPSAQLQRAVDSLSYPRASERFFEEGRETLEQEIQVLGEGELAASEGKLEIDENLLIELEQQRLRLEETKPELN